MAELKTQKNNASVSQFLDKIEDQQKRKDCKQLKKLMEQAAGGKAFMWGDSIVGVGDAQLIYPNGRVLDWFALGFSPRKQNISLYLLDCGSQKPKLLQKLGKHKTGKSCIYIKRLEDIDQKVLDSLFQEVLKNN